MRTRTRAVGGTNTTTGAGTAFRTAPGHSPSTTMRHLASRATSAPHRRLGAHGAGAAVSAAWTVIVVVAVSAVEVSSTVGGAVCLAVVVGIAGVVVLVVEGVGVEVGSVDFVVASVVGDDAGLAISKILTVEYPVEYQLKGVNQIPVRPKIGLSFAAGLRHIVRCGIGLLEGASVRVWEVMPRHGAPRTGDPVPEGRSFAPRSRMAASSGTRRGTPMGACGPFDDSA